MVAATILQDINQLMLSLKEEVVRLEVSDGETYVSRKFSLISGASISLNSDNDLAGMNVTFSGKTATINHTGAADRVMTLTLYGPR